MSNATSSAVVTLVLIFSAANGAASAAVRTCDATVVATNERVARLVFEEILSKGRIAENEGIYDSNFVAHGINRDSHREADRAATRGWRSAVPDLRMEVLRTVADCNQVAVHWRWSGTNSGTGNGCTSTGKHPNRLWGLTSFRMKR